MRKVDGYGQVAGCCEHGDEISRFIQRGEFVDLLNNYNFLRK